MNVTIEQDGIYVFLHSISLIFMKKLMLNKLIKNACRHKKDINVQKVGGMVRKLPPSNDVLTFSWVVESFLKNLRKTINIFQVLSNLLVVDIK